MEQTKPVSLEDLFTRNTVIQSRGFKSGDIIGRIGTLLRSLKNPDRILQEQGLRIDAYEELFTDPKVSAAHQAFLSGVLTYSPTIDRAKCPERIYREVSETFMELDYRRIIREFVASIDYGYSFSEVVYEPRHARIELVDIRLRPHAYFSFDEFGTPLFLSAGNPNGELLKRYKFVVLQNGATAINPYGSGTLSKCYWPVLMKRGLQRFYMETAERYGSPFLVGTYNPAMVPEQKDKDNLYNLLLDMIQGGVVLMPDGSDVNAMEVNAKSSADLYLQGIEYLDKIITQTFLGHEGTMEATPGSLGDQPSAVNVRQDIIESALAIIEHGFNQALRHHLDLNYRIDRDLYPRFVMKERETVDLQKLNRDGQLISLHGISFTKEHYVNTYGLNPDEFKLPVTEKGNELQGTVGGSTLLYTLHKDIRAGLITARFARQHAMTSLKYNYVDAHALFPDSEQGEAPPAEGSEFLRSEIKRLDNASEDGETDVEVPEDSIAEDDGSSTIELIAQTASEEQVTEAIISEMTEKILSRIESMDSEEEIVNYLESGAFEEMNSDVYEELITRMEFFSSIAGSVAES